MILKTLRLSISQLEPDRDEAFILELLNTPGFRSQIADRGVRDLAGARQYLLEGPLTSYAAKGFGLWRADLTATGQPIGICGLIKRDVLEDVDIGYAILPRFEGIGLTSEAARAVIEYGFEALGLSRIVAITKPDNTASIRVLEKLGFAFEKMLYLVGHDGPSRHFVREAQAPSSRAATGAK